MTLGSPDRAVVEALQTDALWAFQQVCPEACKPNLSAEDLVRLAFAFLDDHLGQAHSASGQRDGVPSQPAAT